MNSSAPSTPSSPPPRKKGRTIACSVRMLDDTVEVFHVPVKSTGQVLFNEVVQKLNLLESDYFDLEYTDYRGLQCWLDREKLILRQLSRHKLDVQFVVKFYTPDPELLEDELTRYLFALQVKRDLATGALPCHEHTAILIASYIVQSELGDYVEGEFGCGPGYLKTIKLLPQQSEEFELKIMGHHREHFGQTPAEADISLLDIARKVEHYGLRMFPAKDHDGVALCLSVAHMGILVFQSSVKINTFSWAKIRKLSFKRRKFLIKLHPEGYGFYKDTVEFYFDSRDTCKNFWKYCLENHAFFRCQVVRRLPRHRGGLTSTGSSFRYSGRTQKQLTEYVRENCNVKRSRFQRSTSSRTMSLGATPRTGTLNSHDLHLSQMTNMSSGSRLISASPPTSPDRRYFVPNSNSFSGGSPGQPRYVPPSEVSPRPLVMPTYYSLERNNSPAVTQAWTAAPAESPRKPLSPLTIPSIAVDTGASGDNEDRRDRSARQDVSPRQNQSPRYDTSPAYPQVEIVVDGEVSPTSDRLDPTRFVLMKDRNNSTPAFPVAEQSPQLSLIEPAPVDLLARSPEIENIPEQLTVAPVPGLVAPYQRTHGLQHSQSATPPSFGNYNRDLGLSVAYSPAAGGGNTPPEPPPPAYDGLAANGYQSPRQNRAAEMNGGILLQPSIREDRAEVDSFGDGGSSPGWQQDHGHPTGMAPISFTVTSNTYTSDGSLASSSLAAADDETRHKQLRQLSRAYYIGKELLMTERTYKKDLDIINVWFRDTVATNDVMSDSLMELLFGLINPLCQFHAAFLKRLEQRLTKWEAKSGGKIVGDTSPLGDLFLNVAAVLEFYRTFLDNVDSMLVALDAECKDSHAFDRVYREFEAQKICYLPINAFLLKPAQRLQHYCVILNKLLQFYGSGHTDYADCYEALSRISEVTRTYEQKFKRSEMLQKLIELQQDLVGIDNLLQSNREFIREGCLQKLSSKGYQQRMFFLFTDILVYASRTATRSLQFKVHGCLTVKGMALRDTDPKMAVPNSFTVYAGNRLLVVAASSEVEKNKWMEDLQMVLERPENEPEPEKLLYSSLKSNSSSEVSDDSESESIDRQIQHRTNTLMHVCWHRNTSVSMMERSIAVRNLLSGYLLRKFKSGSGWQKLWVVFTNFCLFFYKSHQDEHPLASLPLLGYAVQLPTPDDGIQKEFVFKLQFKNHVYLFRAESQYTFDRWMEVITMATCKSRHLRLFSRMESESASAEAAT